jgi:hypothetical protein
MRHRTGFLAGAAVCLAMLVANCGPRTALTPTTIEITLVPEAAEGGADRLVPIAGRVRGAPPGTRIVLYARSAVWWVQPLGNEPFTEIAADGTWKNQTHLGTEYAALLVGPEFKPPPTVQELPSPGGPIAAVVVAKGTGELAQRPRRTITFSGYEWDIRQVSSDRGGANQYDAGNVWVDDKGHLHLKLTQRDGRWTSAEVTLTRSLGYGTYLFVVSDVSQLEPTATLSMLTWDDEALQQNHRELDIEISRWGDAASLNAQYVVQPYYVAANVARFDAPAGRLTHSWRWEPGRAVFRTVKGTNDALVASHEFTAGVPVPGSEQVRMNLYYFRYSSTPLVKDMEVVIERFQYLP